MRISFSPLVLAVASLMLLSPAVYAQDTKGDGELPESQAGTVGPRVGAAPKGEGPKTEVVATHGAWAVQCTELPAEQGGKSCGMIQNAKNEKDERIALSVVVSQFKAEGKTRSAMRLVAPLGVYLPTGIAIEIDGKAMPGRMPFLRCIGRICMAEGEVTPETMTKFKKGTSATFYLNDRPGNSYPMKVSLEGFGAALAVLDKL